MRRPETVDLGLLGSERALLATQDGSPDDPVDLPATRCLDDHLVEPDEHPVLLLGAEVDAEQIPLSGGEHQAAEVAEDLLHRPVLALEAGKHLDGHPVLDRLRRPIGLHHRRVDPEIAEHARVEARRVRELGDDVDVRQRPLLPGHRLAQVVGGVQRPPAIAGSRGDKPRGRPGARQRKSQLGLLRFGGRRLRRCRRRLGQLGLALTSTTHVRDLLGLSVATGVSVDGRWDAASVVRDDRRHDSNRCAECKGCREDRPPSARRSATGPRRRSRPRIQDTTDR